MHGDSNIMNKQIIDTFENDTLDALFATARDTQPNLMNDNFTKTLMNSLPTIRRVVRKDTSKKGLSFDLLGAMIGLLMAYLFIDKTSLLSSFVGLMPETLVISPVVVLFAIGAVGLSSLVAWWAVEDSRL